VAISDNDTVSKTETHARRYKYAHSDPTKSAFFWLSGFFIVYCARPEDWIPGLKYLPLAKMTAIPAMWGLFSSWGRTRRSPAPRGRLLPSRSSRRTGSGRRAGPSRRQGSSRRVPIEGGDQSDCSIRHPRPGALRVCPRSQPGHPGQSLLRSVLGGRVVQCVAHRPAQFCHRDDRWSQGRAALIGAGSGRHLPGKGGGVRANQLPTKFPTACS